MTFDVAIWGTVAEWVSGLGTLVAVSVALWLGVRAPREFLNFDVFYQDRPEPLLNLTIRNAGMMEVVVTLAALHHRGVFVSPRVKHSLPLRLAPGHEGTLVFQVGGVTPRKRELPWLHLQTGRGKTYNVPLSAEVVRALGA